MPVVLLSATEYMKVLFKGLISTFTGSICLRVIGRADILFDVQDAAESCRELRYKVDILVQDYLVRYTVVRNNVV